jgi:transcriptional regulator with XRE-family HTH domain
MGNLQSAIGERIKQQRLQSGLGQTQVARDLGISVAALSKIENGKTDLNVSRLAQIAAYFKIPIAQLLGLAENTDALASKGEELLKLQQELTEKKQEITALQAKVIRLYEKLGV